MNQKRKTQKPGASASTTALLYIDTQARQVWLGERALNLTKLEYGCLEFLAQRAGHVVTYPELWHEVWRHSTFLNEHEQQTVRQCIKRVRTKLGERWDAPHFLFCVRDVGFRLDRANVKME